MRPIPLSLTLISVLLALAAEARAERPNSDARTGRQVLAEQSPAATARGGRGGLGRSGWTTIYRTEDAQRPATGVVPAGPVRRGEAAARVTERPFRHTRSRQP